jgi:hypothetical protein
MKVDYDSEAHSILFEIDELRHFEKGDPVEVLGDYRCIVGLHDGHVNHIQLLNADMDIALLDEAAERFDMDAVSLRAAAQAALAAPDREIRIEVDKHLTVEGAPVPTGVTRPSG